MTLEEAERWLWENASTTEHGLAEELALREASSIPTIMPKSPAMWGPADYEDWSHADLVWRVVFLQCVLRRLHQR
jgi:hypothetical protein